MAEYTVTIREVVTYKKKVEAESLEHLAEMVETIDNEADFDPIKDFVSADERDILAVTDAGGRLIKLPPLVG